MRLYLAQLTGTGTTEDPFRCVLSGRGYKVRRIADFRTNRASKSGWALWLCRTDDAQHAGAIATPGVVYVPFEDLQGRPLGPESTVADIDPVKRDQIVAFLRARGIPTSGIRLADTLRDVVMRLVRRGQLASWLRADDWQDLALDLTLRDIPSARRNRIATALEARGFVINATLNTTVEELLESLIAQNDAAFPSVAETLLA